MAVVARVYVGPADQALHDRVEEAVGSRIEEIGGPPAGLMAHISAPTGEGFEIIEVWRSEETWTDYWTSIALPAISGAGATAPDAPTVTPVWGFARP